MKGFLSIIRWYPNCSCHYMKCTLPVGLLKKSAITLIAFFSNVLLLVYRMANPMGASDHVLGAQSGPHKGCYRAPFGVPFVQLCLANSLCIVPRCWNSSPWTPALSFRLSSSPGRKPCMSSFKFVPSSRIPLYSQPLRREPYLVHCLAEGKLSQPCDAFALRSVRGCTCPCVRRSIYNRCWRV